MKKVAHDKYSTSTKWCLIKVLFFISPFISQAQLQQNDRLEIPLLRNENSFEVLPTRDEGIVLYREIAKPTQGFQIIHVDTLFKQKWAGLLPVDFRMQLAHVKEANKKSYFLFHRKDFSEVNFYIYEVELSTGDFQLYKVDNFIPFAPTHFEITKAGVLIGGYFVGHIPIVLFFDFSILKSKILPGLFNESGELNQIKINEDDSFSVLINSKNFSKQKTLWIRNYSGRGDLIHNSTLAPHEGSSLLFGRILSLNKETQIIAGVYGNRNSDFSRGIFLARIDSGSNQQLLYYPFTEMQNFFKYMKAKREKRVVERIERKKIKGKKIRLQYRFLVHEF
ncbi:MAG: hypothetical protein OEU76_08575, partial [Cyclobacteriaceae bacterium]|nr:hypothetical protein [Cyclobacteriaceae bacterium]